MNGVIEENLHTRCFEIIGVVLARETFIFLTAHRTFNRDTIAKLESTAEHKCRACRGTFFILLLGEGHSFTFPSCCTETAGKHRARLGG